MAEQWLSTVAKVHTHRAVVVDLRHLSRLSDVLDALVKDWAPMVHALENGKAGISSSFGGGRVAGGERSDPTFSAVNALLEGRTDRAVEDLATISSFINTVGPLVLAADSIRRRTLAEPSPVPRQCENPNGCPSNSRPRSNSGGLCDACRKHLDRHDKHRETARGEAA